MRRGGGCIRNMYTLWKMHTEWCPAWAIRNIRDHIFHGTGCGGRGGCIWNMYTLWKMQSEAQVPQCYKPCRPFLRHQGDVLLLVPGPPLSFLRFFGRPLSAGRLCGPGCRAKHKSTAILALFDGNIGFIRRQYWLYSTAILALFDCNIGFIRRQYWLYSIAILALFDGNIGFIRRQYWLYSTAILALLDGNIGFIRRQ